MKVDAICNALLETLAESSYNESTLFNYRGVIRRFKAFCKEKGVLEYVPELGQAYASDVVSKKTGKFSKQRYFSQGRFARLLTSYYYTGSFDLLVMKRGRGELYNEGLNKLYNEYISYLKEKYPNKNTVRFYDYETFCLFQYMATIRIYELDEVLAATIVAYLKTIKRQRAVLCGLRLYFTFIGRIDLFAVIDGMHTYRTKRIIPMLTDDENDRLRNTIESGGITKRDAAILLLGLSTGIRAIDLVSLRLSSINWNSETISFKQSKTGNPVWGCSGTPTPVPHGLSRRP
jgi:site-specific recombinase XerD